MLRGRRPAGRRIPPALAARVLFGSPVWWLGVPWLGLAAGTRSTVAAVAMIAILLVVLRRGIITLRLLRHGTHERAKLVDCSAVQRHSQWSWRAILEVSDRTWRWVNMDRELSGTELDVVRGRTHVVILETLPLAVRITGDAILVDRRAWAHYLVAPVLAVLLVVVQLL